MTYEDFIGFCKLIINTDAEKDTLAKMHVRPDGAIAVTLIKVLEAIMYEQDFDYRQFMADLIDYVEGSPEYQEKKAKLLH